MSLADARDRLLAAQALETVRCLEEGVITDPSQCDVGAILGWGFAPWTGGPLSWIDRMGVGRCVARCRELSDRYGSIRLTPPKSLQELAAGGGSVRGEVAATLQDSSRRTRAARRRSAAGRL